MLNQQLADGKRKVSELQRARDAPLGVDEVFYATAALPASEQGAVSRRVLMRPEDEVSAPSVIKHLGLPEQVERTRARAQPTTCRHAPTNGMPPRLSGG